MRHVTRCFVVGIIVLLAGCRENAPVQPSPSGINALLVDGSTNGNPHVFFLPPLVSNPSFSGTFNRNLAPFVEVCQLTADPRLDTPTLKAGCARDVSGAVIFALRPTRMTLDASNTRYQYNWDTGNTALNATLFYRIIVRGSPQSLIPLGSIDVDPVLGGMRNVKTNDVVQFQDGRTLPISVRIENQAFGATNSNDFVEQVVPNVIPGGTLDVTTNTGFAGARFTSGWLRPDLGIDQVVVIIERIGVNDGAPATSCLISSLEEMEGCYRFRTDPDLHLIEGALPFAQNVIAGVCFQIPVDIGLANGLPFQLVRREEVEGQPSGPITNLEEAPAPFLRCGGFGPTVQTLGAAFRSGRVGDIAQASWHAVTRTIARVIQPAALHAVDLGAGGSTDGFSRFGYVRVASMTVTAGEGATAPAGSTVQASVQVQSNHHGVLSPVAGQLVTFTTTGGGGTVSTGSCPAGNSCTTPTGTDGVATVSWQLGLGVNTLQATTTHVINSPQTITAFGAGTQPLLAYRHSEQYSVDAVLWDRYRLTVTNRSSFPASIFAPAPDLPPCGTNTNSSQSWVDIYDGGTNAPIYGFCALTSPDELNDIWFAVPRWTQPPASVYITITDRRANVVYTSNTIQLFGPLFVNFPRQVELDWSPVAGAASYEIEMQYCESWGSPDWRTCNLSWKPWTHLLSYTAGVSYVDTFVGDQPGRWRVRAKDANGNPISSFTAYKYFTYITGPNAP